MSNIREYMMENKEFEGPSVLEMDEKKEEKNGGYQQKCIYIDTFCLGCRRRSVPLPAIHGGCEGKVPLVWKEFWVYHFPGEEFPPDDSGEGLAKRKVEEEIEKLLTDDSYFEDMRAKFNKGQLNEEKE